MKLGIDGLLGVGVLMLGGFVELVAFEHGSEVGAADLLGVDELLGCSLGEDAAVGEDVGAITDAEGLLDIVVGDEDGDAALGELSDFFLEVFDGDGVDAGEWFVEEDELWVGDEGAGDLEFAAFAAGAGAGEVVCFVGEAELFEELGGASFAIGAGELECLEDGQEVLLAGEALEDGGFLGEVAHTHLGVSVHGEAGDFGVVEDDASGVAFDHADGHSEGGGFACAVASEEADDLGVLDFEGYAVDDGASVE
tara:strand:- start:1536 stop:2291 length:756 start_codon:yes stop_codon:yes gene_type:complete